MLAWIVNKLWPLLEPKLKKLVQDAVDRAVADISDEVQALPAKFVNDLADKIPGLGFLKGLI